MGDGNDAVDRADLAANALPVEVAGGMSLRPFLRTFHRFANGRAGGRGRGLRDERIAKLEAEDARKDVALAERDAPITELEGEVATLKSRWPRS